MTNDAHARPRGSEEEPLYDINVATPTHGERAMTLACRIRTATLATIAREPEGYPYGSFVTFAVDDGSPVSPISALAEHTRNLMADARASLLVAENVQAIADAGELLGLMAIVGSQPERAAARRAFLAAHPNAAYYAGYGDFSWWKLTVESVRYIGGYGRMSWVSREDWYAVAARTRWPNTRRASSST